MCSSLLSPLGAMPSHLSSLPWFAVTLQQGADKPCESPWHTRRGAHPHRLASALRSPALSCLSPPHTPSIRISMHTAFVIYCLLVYFSCVLLPSEWGVHKPQRVASRDPVPPLSLGVWKPSSTPPSSPAQCGSPPLVVTGTSAHAVGKGQSDASPLASAVRSWTALRRCDPRP